MILHAFLAFIFYFHAIQSYSVENVTEPCDTKPLLQNALKTLRVNFPHKMPRKLWICRYKDDFDPPASKAPGPCPKNASHITHCYSNAKKGFYPYVCFTDLEIKKIKRAKDKKNSQTIKKVTFSKIAIVTKNHRREKVEKMWRLSEKCQTLLAKTSITKRNGDELNERYISEDCEHLLLRMATGGDIYGGPGYGDEKKPSSIENFKFCTKIKKTTDDEHYMKNFMKQITRASKCIELIPNLEQKYKKKFKQSIPHFETPHNSVLSK